MNSSATLLKNQRFLPLFLTQFFSAFNDNAFKNAFLIWFAYDVALKEGLNASTIITLAAGLFILPFFLFSATAGQIADKYQKSWLIRKLKQLEIALVLLCSFFFILENIYGLLTVLFLSGVQSTFFSPVKYSLLPEHLKEDELIPGNALIEGGTFLAILLGTIFGGLIIRTPYGPEILSFCVVSLAISGWISSCFIPEAPIRSPHLKIGWNPLGETWKIIGYAREEPTVWLSIVGISWFWLIGAVFLTQFPIYTKEIIGGSEHIVTLFLTIFSIGIGIGSLGCNKLLNGQINGRFVPYGSLGLTLTILAFVGCSFLYKINYPITQEIGFLPFLSRGLSWSILLSLLGIALCAGIYIVPLYAIMQHRANQNHMARIVSVNNLLNALFMVLASLSAFILFAFSWTVLDVFLTVALVNIPVFFVIRGIVKRRLKNA